MDIDSMTFKGDFNSQPWAMWHMSLAHLVETTNNNIDGEQTQIQPN
jgi:hypothetical protein